MDYSSAVAYLTGHERLGIKFGLENIGHLLEALGHPERAWRSILIAGTNGKGSAVAMIESVLRAAGHRTGRYTSPHLVRLEERMLAGGKSIEPEELAAVVRDVKDVTEDLRRRGTLLGEPTFFELTTACGFEFFRRQRVDIAVIEVGMGGRWDATNVVPASITGVTNIGLDHERFLGNTLAKIAAEKAATIKQGRPVVTGVREEEPLRVIRTEADRRHAPLHLVRSEVSATREEVEGGQRVQLETPVRSYRDLFLPLLGDHQIENLALAVRVAELSESAGLSVEERAVLDGIASTQWPGRLERFQHRPALIVDAAHNPLGVAALATYLEAHPHPDRVLLFGVMKDKRGGEMLDLLLPHVRDVVITRPPSPRAQAPATVARALEGKGRSVSVVETPELALERARRLAGVDGEVLITGSVFLAGEVERQLLDSRSKEPVG